MPREYKVKFVDFPKNYHSIKKEIDIAILKVLNNGDFILRDDVEEFEKNLAKFVGIKYAVGLNSGTDALTLSLKACGIEQGDKVITSAYTFWATIEAIYNVGAEPILIDIKRDLIIDFEEVERRIKECKAIIPIWIGGYTREIEKLRELAIKYNIIIIEDACQALGAKNIGKWSDVACFSFYPAKILGAYGDAGAIVTNNWKIAEKVKLSRDHCRITKEKIIGIGYNSRLDNLQAAILNVKMKYLSQWIKRRKEIAKIYDEGLKDLEEIELPISDVYQEYNLRVKNERNKLYEFLKKNGIETLKGIYKFPIWQPEMTQIANNEILRLPICPELTNEEIEYVIKSIKEFYG